MKFMVEVQLGTGNRRLSFGVRLPKLSVPNPLLILFALSQPKLLTNENRGDPEMRMRIC